MMLILTRHVGETILVGEDVAVTVLGVTGNLVRVGIAAPANVAVHREEIYARIQRQKAEGSVDQLLKPLPGSSSGSGPTQ